jgi:iron complex transport system ATP-binding protein
MSILEGAGRMTLLEVRGVSFSYPGGPLVLRDVSLAVERGSIGALLGPNGVGKSTLLDLCLGWRDPDLGEVLLGGSHVRELGRSERGRLLSLVPQRENVRFDFSVLDYVLLGRAPHLAPLQSPGAHDRSVAREALKAAGIPGLAGRSITTLSGGEYQLMLIARSLAQEPAVLLMDEPGSHLDPGHRLRVMRTMRSLAGGGIAVLLTSHDPQGAAAVADTIHLMKGGRIVRSGSPRTVLTAAALRDVYGVPFRVRWSAGRFSCSFETVMRP